MASESHISWTKGTWNPVVGCTKISSSCAFCYAEHESKRQKGMGTRGYEKGFTHVTLMHWRLNEPITQKDPTLYFVPSMGDLFHKNVPFKYIDDVMDVMRLTPRHVYLLLTKRAKRMRKYFKSRTVPFNCVVGVSVENIKQGVPRIAVLQSIDAAERFLSVEPLLEDLGDLNLKGIGVVIVGGESGHKARRMEAQWAANIKRQCDRDGVGFHFKQWGSIGPDGKRRSKESNGRIFQGRTWDVKPGESLLIATDSEDSA